MAKSPDDLVELQILGTSTQRSREIVAVKIDDNIRKTYPTRYQKHIKWIEEYGFPIYLVHMLYTYLGV